MSKEELEAERLKAARHHNEGLALKDRKADIDWWEKIYHSVIVSLTSRPFKTIDEVTGNAAVIASESLKRRQEFLDSLTPSGIGEPVKTSQTQKTP